jgi:hypothetical protein
MERDVVAFNPTTMLFLGVAVVTYSRALISLIVGIKLVPKGCKTVRYCSHRNTLLIYNLVASNQVLVIVMESLVSTAR